MILSILAFGDTYSIACKLLLLAVSFADPTYSSWPMKSVPSRFNTLWLRSLSLITSSLLIRLLWTFDFGYPINTGTARPVPEEEMSLLLFSGMFPAGLRPSYSSSSADFLSVPGVAYRSRSECHSSWENRAEATAAACLNSYIYLSRLVCRSNICLLCLWLGRGCTKPSDDLLSKSPLLYWELRVRGAIAPDDKPMEKLYR